jgi:hypothetical protein
MTTLLDADGNPVELSDLDLDAKFEQIKDAPSQDLPAPPRRAPTPKPASRGRTHTTRGTSTKARTKTEPVAATPAVTEARKKKVSEVLTITSGALLVAGKAYSSDSLRADGHTLNAVTPQLSEAVANVAAHDPAVARLLDAEGSAKVASYIALFSVTFSLGAQVAANHNLIKPGTLQTAAPADIIAHFETEPANETDDGWNE